MMASVFLSRAIGLGREMAIAFVGGAGAGVDAYQVAFVLPEMLNHVVASGFLSVTFIPIFARHLADGREEEGWRVFSAILSGFGLLLLLLIGLGEWFSPQLVSLLAPGLEDPAVIRSAVRMTRIILPAQFFFFAGGLFMAVQFAKERFAVPALAPLLYNLGIIGGGLVLGRRLGMEGFAWGVLGGAFAGNFLVQLWGALRVGMVLRPALDFRHPDVIQYLRLTLPLMVGLTMTFSTEIFFKFFGSFLPRGGIAALNYGLRIMLMLVGLFGQAAGVASYPFLARLAAEGKIAEMNRLLNATLRFLLLVIPLSALFMVLREEVVRVLFQRGAFDAADTRQTAEVLLWLLTGTAAFAAQTVVVRGFYAVQNTLLPAVFGTAAVALSLPVYVAGVRWMGAGGVALAVAASATLQVWLLFCIWNRRSENAGGKSVYLAFFRMLALAVLVGPPLEWLRRTAQGWIDTGGVFGSLAMCVGIGLAFLLLAIPLGRLLGIGEIDRFRDRLAGRIRRRG
jgi:putative peptidoglycan lipid II flippase